MERLLTWFFAEELPPALRGAESATPMPTRLPTTQRMASRSAGRWLVPLCAAALLVSGWLMYQLPQHAAPVVTMQTPGVEVETVGWPLVVEEVSYRGSTGSFAQRTELRWTSHSHYEPHAGTWVEWSAPELVIDVAAVEAAEGGAP